MHLWKTVFILLVMPLLLIPGADGVTVADSEDVDIDQYITVRIVFDEGESLELEADITASRDPISVFLIKGEEEFLRWQQTEEVDIDDIKAGENVSKENESFQVITNFAERNVTSFSRSITIGDRDAYYLIIAIYREEGMSSQEVLSRGSRVDYTVSWEEKERYVPYYLIPVAILLFIVGLVLVILYFRFKASEEEEEDLPSERKPRSNDRKSMPPGGPKGPPYRPPR